MHVTVCTKSIIPPMIYDCLYITRTKTNAHFPPFFQTSAPSILPKYIWNFKHVDTGVVKDSSPVLLVHGVYEPEEESLRLLSSDSWIDAGDFTGI